MQPTERVRTPPDNDARERLFVRPDASHDVEISESDDGNTEITVPISSTTEHRSGSRMTESALESMADQLAAGTVGLWDDHGLDDMGWPEYRRADMYGHWVDGTVEDGTLYGTARLRDGDERAADLVDQLDQGMPVGFSVGHIPTEVRDPEADDHSEDTREFLDVDLLEVSPVGIPDNPNAYAEAGVARAVAHSVTEAGIDLDRQAAAAIADGVTDALQTMDESTDTNDADEPEDEETESGEEPDSHQDDVDDLLDAIGEVVAAELATHRDEMRAVIEDVLEADDDEDDEEEAEGDTDDDEEEESASTEEALEQLRAKVDRLESESRESAGRKGITTAEAGDEDDEETAGTGAEAPPRNALQEAALLEDD